MNLATQLTSVDRGGQGLHLLSLVDPIGQQLTNTAAAALKAPRRVRFHHGRGRKTKN